MTTTDHINLAKRLREAYNSGAVPPLRDLLEGDDATLAYAVQEANIRFWQSEGRRIVGRKIGLTAKSVQKQLGVDQPDYGVLFDDMQIADQGVLAPSRVIQPKVEAEVALMIGSDLLSQTPTPGEILAATEYVVAAIEIVDSRIADWKITFADTVADNGSSAFFVLGQERRAVADLDLYTCGMALEINGDVASVGAGAACLGHPLNAAAWLARVMVANGTPLRAGDIVLTGALGPMVTLTPGDHVCARIGGLGAVSFTFEEQV